MVVLDKLDLDQNGNYSDGIGALVRHPRQHETYAQNYRGRLIWMRMRRFCDPFCVNLHTYRKYVFNKDGLVIGWRITLMIERLIGVKFYLNVVFFAKYCIVRRQFSIKWYNSIRSESSFVLLYDM